MLSVSSVEARERFDALLDASERGASTLITRDGRPVAELRPVRPPGIAKRVSAESIDWIEQQLADLPPPTEDSVAQLDAVRDGKPEGA